MSAPAVRASTEVATTNTGPIGLEDLAPTDLVMPRLEIDHENAKYVDSLSGEKFDKLDVVLLGLIKQRTLWPATISTEKRPPMCKSYEAAAGHPGDDFPWKASGFTEADYPEGKLLPCESCPLKEWGSHPTRENVPWCEERFVLPLMLSTGSGAFAPALFEMKRSALKAARAYISSFARKGNPLFVNYTTLTLSANLRGTVKFAVPGMALGPETELTDRDEFAEQYRMIRSFVQTPRRDDAAEDETAAATAPAPAPIDDDEIPF